MPIDIGKHVAYWRTGATEDIETARLLLEHDRRRAASFIAHLALEKALKALVVKATGDLTPLIHNLVVLAEKTSQEFQESGVGPYIFRRHEPLFPPWTLSGSRPAASRSP